MCIIFDRNRGWWADYTWLGVSIPLVDMDIEFESWDDPSRHRRLRDRTGSTIASNPVSGMNSK